MKEKEGPSDNAAFDVHLTDPARLKAEIKKDMKLQKLGEKWYKLSDKQKENVRKWCERNSRNGFAQSCLKSLKARGYLSDAQVDSLPNEATR